MRLPAPPSKQKIHCYGIRFERKLCEDVALRLAYLINAALLIEVIEVRGQEAERPQRNARLGSIE